MRVVVRGRRSPSPRRSSRRPGRPTARPTGPPSASRARAASDVLEAEPSTGSSACPRVRMAGNTKKKAGGCLPFLHLHLRGGETRGLCAAHNLDPPLRIQRGTWEGYGLPVQVTRPGYPSRIPVQDTRPGYPRFQRITRIGLRHDERTPVMPAQNYQVPRRKSTAKNRTGGHRIAAFPCLPRVPPALSAHSHAPQRVVLDLLSASVRLSAVLSAWESL